MDNQWRALRIDGRRSTSIIKKINDLREIECYAPARLELRKRSDRPGYNLVEELLFPDYLLLKFDPYVVHTTQVNAIGGTYGFVAFGNQLPAIIQPAQIEQLKSDLLAHNNRIRNKGPVTIGGGLCETRYRVVVQGLTKADRQGAFLQLFEQKEEDVDYAIAVNQSQQHKPARMVLNF